MLKLAAFALLTTVALSSTKTLSLDYGSLLNGADSLLDDFPGLADNTKNTLKLAKKVNQKLNSSDKLDFSRFFKFIADHGRDYSDESTLRTRFSHFQDTLQQISQLNSQHKHATFGINKFSDLSPEEFLNQSAGTKPANVTNGIPYWTLKYSRAKRSTSGCNSPSTFDWRDEGAYTEVKDQGSCGDCYVFSSIAAVEAVYIIANNISQELSEQQTLSCNPDSGNYGCDGGVVSWTLDAIISAGVDYEEDYPYTNGNSTVAEACIEGKARYQRISTYTYTTQYDEVELVNAVYKLGPAIVVIDATNLQSYQSGVLEPVEPEAGWTINHGVTIFGYGEDDDVPFWSIKNSWGADWGESGYFRLLRGNNSLDVAWQPIIPIV
ncbi:unnamed protein product [Bursaphelenchus okinawaensis]|uniref:Uncharacterized protein n=1 Tax=Bursaphelenchus okinawaensis TaxID=465554 RepID=A0A811LJP5_9BILA|nr:unnamed protein product [Bursaphelenchus okinawaensis]CAG9127266.1 unnamed protein product [Bursaphelenchus okinawaensis]